ncbi:MULTISPECIES: hypothetical protein [unclassified Amycolatopsis]|uniref:hypothetical protein n=1 Tax=unclassified Amycolatopsis TaxID=2618356 RepID=UPI00287B5E05|nr:MULTISPECIES: hypothetical protein [unclassified Amycolatopsis]
MTETALRPAVIALAGGLRKARNERGIGLRRLADMIGVYPAHRRTRSWPTSSVSCEHHAMCANTSSTSPADPTTLT